MGGSYLIKEDTDIHRTWFRHLIVSSPGTVVLMPLSNLTNKGGFSVYLLLVYKRARRFESIALRIWIIGL